MYGAKAARTLIFLEGTRDRRARNNPTFHGTPDISPVAFLVAAVETNHQFHRTLFFLYPVVFTLAQIRSFPFYLSLIRINIAKIAVTPPVVIPDENMFLTVSDSCERISGTNSTLNPKEKLNAITNVALRSMV